jgi:hypothetical protein
MRGKKRSRHDLFLLILSGIHTTTEVAWNKKNSEEEPKRTWTNNANLYQQSEREREHVVKQSYNERNATTMVRNAIVKSVSNRSLPPFTPSTVTSLHYMYAAFVQARVKTIHIFRSAFAATTQKRSRTYCAIIIWAKFVVWRFWQALKQKHDIVLLRVKDIWMKFVINRKI